MTHTTRKRDITKDFDTLNTLNGIFYVTHKLASPTLIGVRQADTKVGSERRNSHCHEVCEQS